MEEEFTFNEKLKINRILNISFSLNLAKAIINKLKEKFTEDLEIFCDANFGTYEIFYDGEFYISGEKNLTEIITELIELRISIFKKFSIIWSIIDKEIVINTQTEKSLEKITKMIKGLKREI